MIEIVFYVWTSFHAFSGMDVTLTQSPFPPFPHTSLEFIESGIAEVYLENKPPLFFYLHEGSFEYLLPNVGSVRIVGAK